MGVTLAHAWAEVWRFNEYYNTLSTKEQVNYYGGKPASINQYLRCFFCGGFCSEMCEFKEGDCPDGVTIQPIVARGDLVFDRAEKDDLRLDNHLLHRAAQLINGLVQLETMDISVLNAWITDYKNHASPEERRDA